MEKCPTFPSYCDIEKGCAKIAYNYMKLNCQSDVVSPTAIVALARGGLIPGVILSHMFDDIPLIPVNYSSKQGNGDDKNHNNYLPPIPLNNYHRLLIVDDISDSGHTLNEVAQYYVQQKIEVSTAVLYYKASSVFVPDFYWKKIQPNSPWIVFPWE